ncbi:MAG: hypothetical protein GWP08_11900 [Nitrospiraceae bacterium]|nr:hypothetical protein [Nitrospiraceae bacterium]
MRVLTVLMGAAVLQAAAADTIRVHVVEVDPALRTAVARRLEARIGGAVTDSPSEADWIVDAPSDAALAERLGGEGFALRSDGARMHVYGNRRRARLYGLWELIEIARRGELDGPIDQLEVPRYAIRGDTQCPHTPYKLSREDTLAFWERYFDWAVWMRQNRFMPFQSNGRVIVPRGYPDYADLDYGKGGGYYAMKRIYDLCQLYDIDFYYPLHLFPVPAETGFRDEPSTGNEFFYPDGVENRVPRNGPMARPYETQYQNQFPEYFTDDGKVDLAFPGLWKAIETELVAAQELFPNMRGVLLNFAETNGHSQKFRALHRQQGTRPVMAKTFDFVRRHAEGKQIVIFHHGPGLLVFRHDSTGMAQDPIDFLKEEAGDFLHLVDLHPGPQHPGQPVFGSVGDVETRRRLCRELDVVLWTICDGEHIGRNAIAYSVPGYIYKDMKTAMGYGIQGSFQRTANYDFGVVPGTVLEVNAYAAYRVLWNPDVSLDTIWEEWLASRFGPGAAPALKPILAPVETVVRKGLLLHNCPMFGLMGLLNAEYFMTGTLYNAAQNGVAGIRYPTILDLFQPPGTLMHEAVTANPRDRRFLMNVKQRARTIADIRSDRQEAVSVAKESVRRLRALKTTLVQDDYVYLLEALVNLQYLTEISALFTNALYLEKMAFVQNYDRVEDPIQKFEEALARLEERVYAIRKEKGDFFFYGLPQAMASYRQIGRLRLEAAVATDDYAID